MTRQLTLLEVPPSWRLDDPTREAGRKGIAQARASLQAAVAAAHPVEPRKGPKPGREHPSHRRSAA
ncbi:MAG: hypothetical protein ACOYXM_12830 [Actinomycetota bacterium]